MSAPEEGDAGVDGTTPALEFPDQVADCSFCLLYTSDAADDIGQV